MVRGLMADHHAHSSAVDRTASVTFSSCDRPELDNMSGVSSFEVCEERERPIREQSSDLLHTGEIHLRRTRIWVWQQDR